MTGAAAGAGPDIHREAAGRLRATGRRYTGGRRRLVDALAGAGRPLSVPELLEADGTAAQSSLYRNLAALEEVGLVHRLPSVDGHARYELAEPIAEHHHHLVCELCGAIVDVGVPPAVERQLEATLASLAAAHGFTVRDHRLDVLGLCRRCRTLRRD